MSVSWWWYCRLNMTPTASSRSTSGLASSHSGPPESELKSGIRRLEIMESRHDHLTHYLFRYPAKFHPPVVKQLIEQYTRPSETILDPFCGSGTLLVEATVLGRSCYGLDIDPLAVEVSWAKTHRFNATALTKSANMLLHRLRNHRRTESEYEDLQFDDIGLSQYETAGAPLVRWIPAIPNLHHWFRRYVVIDLAKIRRTIEYLVVPETHRRFLRVIFGSIIRNASNADPVPVSGLEVTSHMKRRDQEGRVIDPFKLFEVALRKAMASVQSYQSKLPRGSHATLIQGDATQLDRYIRINADAVITSPPYHGAVDYYRRHQLEMFWLGLTETQNDRLELMHHYIGRPSVARSHPFVADGTLMTALAKKWEANIRETSIKRGNAFKHYIVAMAGFFAGLAHRLPPGAPALLVVGHSSWNDAQIPTSQLFAEIASSVFKLEDTLWYPVRNRYMSYSRHNGANIDTEYVLVLRRLT